MDNKETFGMEPSEPIDSNNADLSFKKVISFIRKNEKSKIVDYGCGYGTFPIDGLMQYMDKEQWEEIEYIGVDVNWESIKTAINYLKSFKFWPPDVKTEPLFYLAKDEYLDIEDNSVDHVFLLRSLHDFSLEGVYTSMYNIFRILKPSGKIIIYDKSKKSESPEINYILWEISDFHDLLEGMPNYKIDTWVSRPEEKKRFEIFANIEKQNKVYPSIEWWIKACIKLFLKKRKIIINKIENIEKSESKLGRLSDEKGKKCRELQAQYYTIDKSLKNRFSSSQKPKKGRTLRSIDGVNNFNDLCEVYIQRENYNNLSYIELKRILNVSIEKGFPLLYWCSEYKEYTNEILLELATMKTYGFKERALKLYLFIEKKHPRELCKQFDIEANSFMDSIYQTVGENNVLPFELDYYVDEFQKIEFMTSFRNIHGFREIIKFKDHSDLRIRRMVAAKLGLFLIGPSVPCLFQMLDDEDLGVQNYAVLSLGNLIESRFLGPLGMFHYIWSQHPFKDIEIPFPTMESFYEGEFGEVFIDARGSNSKYLLNRLIDFSEFRDLSTNLARIKTKILPLFGDKRVLDNFLTIYNNVIESGYEDFRSEYMESINILDERVYGEKIYHDLVKGAPYNRCRWYHIIGVDGTMMHFLELLMM